MALKPCCTVTGLFFPVEVRTAAAIVDESERRARVSSPPDILLEIKHGLTVVESFAGIGGTRPEAVADAIRNFANSSFHVLLAAFFD